MVSVAGNPPASVNCSANTNVRVAVLVATLGAVKRACWVVAPVRMTAVPAVSCLKLFSDERGADYG